MTAVAIIVAVVVGVVVGLALGRRQRQAPTMASEPVVDDDVSGEALDVLASAIILADRTGAVLSRNVVAEQLHRSHSGLLIEEAVERHLRRALHGSDTAETIDFYGPPKQTVVVSAVRLPSGGAVAIVDDVTDRRRLDAMRTDFVANISHELKTPVGAMAVLADALVGEDDNEVVQRLILRMVGEAERATRTIDDLLELSEIEQRAIAEPTTVAINQLIDGVIERFAHAAEQRGVTLRREPGAVLSVIGDRRQLSSALGNLIDNAIKYLSILEAMCFGCPSVATRVGGIPELVGEDSVGRLVPSGDVAAMTAELARLIDDPALRQNLGTAAQTRARAQFSSAAIVPQYEALYRRVMAQVAGDR